MESSRMSCRARHLRIKAEGLTEAVWSGAGCLRPGWQVFEARTASQSRRKRSFEKMIAGLRMTGEAAREPISVRRLATISKLVTATVILECCVKGVEGVGDGSDSWL